MGALKLMEQIIRSVHKHVHSHCTNFHKTSDFLYFGLWMRYKYQVFNSEVFKDISVRSPDYLA